MRDPNDLYDPRPLDDEGDAPAAGGYRIRSEATWDRAREAYLAGATAEDVCARFDLGLSVFRDRARRGGWRRRDQADPDPYFEPGPVHLDDGVDFDAGYADLAEHALGQLRRALARGQASAAASWMRLHERLSARARDQAREAAAPPAPAGPLSVEHERLRERIQARRQAAETHVARRDGVEAVERAAQVAARAGDLARRIVACDPRDTVGRAAIDAELARLDADLRAGAAPKPDDPDDPDSVSTSRPREAEGP